MSTKDSSCEISIRKDTMFNFNEKNKIHKSQPACSKLTIETVEQGVKYANSVVLVSLLLTLNIFPTLF